MGAAKFDVSKATFGTYEDRAVWLIGKLLPDFRTWGPLDAFACCGNLGRESGIQMIQEAGQIPPRGGWGLPQWTADRRTAFYAYCSKTGRDIAAMQSGYDFLFVELKGAYAHVVSEVAAAPTLEAKVAAFERHYEMAGVVALSDRVAFAVRAQKAWAAAGGPSVPLPASPPVTVPPPPATAPAPTKGPSSMFSIGSLIALIGQAPTIIESVMTLITEIEAGYAKGKAAGGDPIVVFEDILAAIVANKGSIATAALGNEPKVAANGAVIK